MDSSETERQPSPDNVFKVLSVDTPKPTNTTVLPNPALKNGRILPKKLQNQFTELNAWGKPLEEIDPSYENGKTFTVVASNFRLFRYSSHHSLFLFDPLNALRRFLIFVLTHWIFAFVMTTIVILDFTYLVYSISGTERLPSGHGHVVRIVAFFAYLAEFFLKLISMGFAMSPHTYLRSFWSWVDMIVLTDYLYREIGNDGISWLVSTGVLLKIIPYNSGLHLAFDFCVSCVVRLKEMILASIVVMSMLTILGIQMYLGILTQKCVSNFNSSEFLNVTDEEWHRQWFLHSVNESHWYYTDPAETSAKLCGNATGTGKCPEGFTCLQGYGPNPDYGYTSFDSFPRGSLTVLRLVTQDFAEYLIHQIFLTAGHFHTAYFFAVIFFGTFGLGTFCYSVVAHYFLEMKISREEYEVSPNQGVQNRNETNVFSRMSQNLNLPPGLNSIRRKAHCFVFHPFSEVCIACIVILDVVLMIFNIEQPIFSQIFCWIYIFECIVKMFAESPVDYFKRREHILDIAIVILFVLTWFVNSNLLSSFLVLRMYKLFPRWPSLNFLIQSLVNTWKNYYHFFTLIVIVLLVSAARGVSFHYLVPLNVPPTSAPRWHYKDFEHSFMTVFRIACGEWIECLWDSLLIHEFFGYFIFIPVLLVINLLLVVAAAAIVSETGETFSKIEYQENALYSKFEDGLNRICLPVTWLRSKINPGGQTHNSLDEAPIHRDSQLIDNAGGDCSPLPNSTGATLNESMIDKILQNKYYSMISNIILLWCSFILTFENGPHQEQKPKLSQTVVEGNGIEHSESSVMQLSVFYFDILFTIYFGVDIILNLLSSMLKKRFVTSGWIFDTVLVTEMLFNLIFYSPHKSPLHGFFYVKCFRLFMLVSRVEGLKAVISGFITEFSLLWKYVIAGIFVLLSFDIQGVQLFHDRFGKCLDSEGVTVWAQVVANKSECMKANLNWVNSDTNYDNVLNGIRPLFFTLTVNGWISVLHDAVDSRGIDEQPVQEASYHNVLYFIYTMTFANFFLFFVLVGIIIHYLRTDTYKGIFMSFDQFYEYKNKTRQLLAEANSRREDTSPEKIPEPTWRVLKFFYDVVGSPFFDKFIMCVIIYQMFTMAVDFYDPNYGSHQLLWGILDVSHLIVMVIFIVEMICKLLGWRYHYFKNVFNRIDFVVVVIFILGTMLRDVVEMYFISPILLSVIRFFRIFQFEPFKRRAVMCQKYLTSLGLIRPALLNLFLFLVINLFSFSLLFFATFKNVKLRNALDEDINFQSFRHSVNMLFKFCQFGGWDGAYPALTAVTDCQMPDADHEGDCGSPFKASLMIFCYLGVSVFTVLNIYIVFILEIVKRFSENESKSQNNGPAGISTNNGNSSSPNNSPFDHISAKEFTDASFALH